MLLVKQLKQMDEITVQTEANGIIKRTIINDYPNIFVGILDLITHIHIELIADPGNMPSRLNRARC